MLFNNCYLHLEEMKTFYLHLYLFLDVNSSSSMEDTSLHGGCFRKYKWCSHTTKVPLTAYILCFTIIFGFAFPYLAGPVGTIFSQILGPRKQVRLFEKFSAMLGTLTLKKIQRV